MGRARHRAASSVAERGRLAARPQAPGVAGPRGLQRLVQDARRAALVYVPARYDPQQAAPLAVLLHGAGGTAQHGLELAQALADAAGLIVLAPQSRQATWDVLYEGFGADVAAIDRALAALFRQYVIDPARIAVGGFSDGASYALSLGLTNGDLFTHVIAFSPGFMAPAEQCGRPRLFVAHGVHDTVLPIARCSRQIVPAARAAGYEVHYHEFDGPHVVPPEIAQQAVDWFVARER